MLQSRRGDLGHVDGQFLDDRVKGFDAWIAAAERDLLRWGCMVLRKPVSDARMHNARKRKD